MTATNQERFLLDEAEGAQRRLNEELIAAAREVVAALDAFNFNPRSIDRFNDAIDRLEALVGRA